MKPAKTKIRTPADNLVPSPGDPPVSGALSSRYGRGWFRCLALLLPLFLLLLVEVGLRLAGCGYDTNFFIQTHHNGHSVLVENPQFGWRFFPPAIARSPQPLSLPLLKPPGAIRIFVFGESAAMGDPEPAYGLARQLEKILQSRHPGKTIEVVNVAMTAINSHTIREIARNCAPRAGDFWLIYAGNNEVVGPYGAGTVFTRQAPSLLAVRAELALKSTRVGQLLGGLLTRSGQTEWAGMEMFLHQQVGRDDQRLSRVYENFSANLSGIVSLGRNAGAQILLATMPVNLKDCPPFASLHRTGLTAADLAQWEKLFALGTQAAADQHFSEALTAYHQAALIDGQFAELAFRRAQCELVLGQGAAAKTNFSLARDLDTLRFRADSRLNELIRQTAISKQITFIDAEQEIAARSKDRLPGEDLFYDHVHLNGTGNYAVAALVAAEMEKTLAGPAAQSPLPAESEVARLLAMTDFDRRRVIEEMQSRFRQPPFSTQSNAREREQRGRQNLAALNAPATNGIPVYQAALALSPDDWMLQANFGQLLEAAKDPRASAPWREVIRLMPHEHDAYYHLGNLAYSEGQYAQAEALFRDAVKRNHSCAEALNGLALVQAAQDKTNEAIQQFEAALKIKPRYSAARVNLALVLARAGDLKGAASQYETVLRTDADNVAARINLGKLLASQGKQKEALAKFAEALALSPENAVAHFNLGNALVAENRHAEALPHYAAAVQFNPDFPEARYNFALELVRAGKALDAISQFAEVTRLKPDSAEAHFNYGVALAKAQHYALAELEFRKTLQLHPDHPSAQAALDRTLQLQKAR